MHRYSDLQTFYFPEEINENNDDEPKVVELSEDDAKDAENIFEMVEGKKDK